ncbi:motility associated factor glycosyltransferase family protein [Paenibacillus sp. UASWS1643]|uniref:motility associated factor glycosyltransferase family protein n=1 Tax=Paenibacillus sp. UASWS1643 TaxID=2580422 RepID=UPI00123C22F1|nr:6-hydroxymethylpterin diphosphokinase MptE-like protein [Paenibacillus sp. UASWS1643]KAA8756253.1 motility associated factor glycosyltransferase family protein [Paenibacillus sp. UASWS1643]
MKLIEENINILSMNKLHWIGEPKNNDISFNLYEKDPDKGDLIEVNNQIIYLKNSFDATFLPNVLKKELIFAIGLYSVSELKQLIQTMSKESFLIIIEPSFSFFNHVLNEEELSFIQSSNVILFADDLSSMPMFLEHTFSTSLIFYLKNIKFYFTTYYRDFDVDSCISVVKQIKEVAQYKTTSYGNSVDDSLLGFRQNMLNIKNLARSKDVSQLRDLFKDMPAIVVAAGPSLNKNIKELKKFKGKAVIVAVDTIAERLCQEGIVPDFICSIERGELTYSYFYKDKSYPSEVTLVAPLLVYPEIFEEFQGEVIIPIRDNVGEYNWLKEILNLTQDNSISIGLSCAHIAFGFAEHLGASPIVLVGQDLAYGNSLAETHASNTIYDQKPINADNVAKRVYTKGYSGSDVATTDTWNAFRNWFEAEIYNKQLNVINATEGGALINHTSQMSLKEVYDTYCGTSSYLVSASQELKKLKNYSVDINYIKNSLKDELENFKEKEMKLKKQLIKLQQLVIHKRCSQSQLLKSLKILEKTDVLFGELMSNWLLRHNLQAVLITSVWRLFEIEQFLSADNLSKNRDIQIEFVQTSLLVLSEIIAVLENTIRD